MQNYAKPYSGRATVHERFSKLHTHFSAVCVLKLAPINAGTVPMQPPIPAAFPYCPALHTVNAAGIKNYFLRKKTVQTKWQISG